MRKPLEQFSSAKYEIGGTLDEPEVNLVSVFDRSINRGEAKEMDDESSDQEPDEDLPPDAAEPEN